MQAQTTKILWRPRSFEDADFQKVSDLRKLFMSEDGSHRRSCEPDYYRWKILTNPSGTGIFHVADDNGRIVGITTITPKRLCLRGKLVLGAEIGDTFTHPNYQRQGMFSALVNMTCEKASSVGLEFIYGTPNDQSRPGYEKKLNFAQISSARVYNYVRPIKVAPVLSVRLGRPVLSKFLAPVISAVFHMLYRFRPARTKDIKITLATEFPADVTELWERCASQYSWALKRDKEYLDWRFAQNPDPYEIWIASRNNRTVGYLVTRQGQYGSLKVGYLADFLIDEPSREIFQALLFSAASSFRSAGMDMLATWAVEGGLHQKILSQFGFLQSKPVPVICYKNDLGLQFVQGQDRWHFTMADSDNI